MVEAEQVAVPVAAEATSVQLEYTLAGAAAVVAASRYVPVNLTAFAAAWDPLGAPMEVILRVPWSPELVLLCNARPTALYSASGHGITERSCGLWMEGERVGELSARRSSDGHQLEVEADTAATVVFGRPLHVGLTFGYRQPALALVSEERGASCRRLLFDVQLGWFEALVGDVLFPLKVMLVLMPASLVALLVLLQLVSAVPLCAPPLALAAIAMDAAFMLGTMAFPLCSLAIGGWGWALTDAVVLVVYYGAFFWAFWRVDRLLSKVCRLPASLNVLRLQYWLPWVARWLPIWLPAGILLALGALWTVLYVLTGLLMLHEMCFWTLLIVNVHAVLPVLLLDGVARSASTLRTAGWRRRTARFFLMVEPLLLVLLVLLGYWRLAFTLGLVVLGLCALATRRMDVDALMNHTHGHGGGGGGGYGHHGHDDHGHGHSHGQAGMGLAPAPSMMMGPGGLPMSINPQDVMRMNLQTLRPKVRERFAELEAQQARRAAPAPSRSQPRATANPAAAAAEPSGPPPQMQQPQRLGDHPF